jgi:hypothetical protein
LVIHGEAEGAEIRANPDAGGKASSGEPNNPVPRSPKTRTAWYVLGTAARSLAVSRTERHEVAQATGNTFEGFECFGGDQANA